MSSGAGDVVVMVIASVLVILMMGPSVMLALRRTSVRSHAVETPAAAAPRGDDPLYQQRFDQFAALGFQPVGLEHQIGWFLSPWDWKKKFEQRWLALPDGQTFGSMSKMIPQEPWRFGLVTLVSGGCVVRTSCPGVDGMDDASSNYRVTRLPGADPAELLAHHRAFVETVCRERGATIEATTFSRLAALESALGQALLNKGPDKVGKSFLTLFLMPVLLVLTVTIPHHGLRAIDVAYAGGIASIAFWLFCDFVLIRQHRAAILASHSDRRR